MARGSEPTRLKAFQLAAYSAPALPVTMALYAVSVVIPGHYATATRLGAATIGAVLLLSRIGDVCFDVLVGYLSDRTPARWGGRRPWMVAGALLIAPSFLVLATPDAGTSAAALFASLLGFYLGWSLLVAPHSSWGSEVAASPGERSRIFTWRAGAGYIGSVAFALVPLLPMFPTSEFSGASLQFAALLVAGLLLVSVPLALILVRDQGDARARRPDLAQVLYALGRNRPLRLYVVATVLNGLANGMFIAVVYLYQTEYLRLGDMTWLVLLVYIGASLLALPLWSWLIRRLGTARAWALGLGVSALAYLPLAWLPPGPASLGPVLAIFFVAGGAYSVANIATMSVMGDISEYEMVRSNTNLTGNLYALQALIDKFNMAVGAGLAFLLIGAMGFRSGTPVGGQALAGLQLAHIYLPSLLSLASLGLIWRFPLTPARQQQIAAILKARARRATAA